VPIAQHGYVDVTSGYNSVCKYGIVVAVWLIISATVSIVLTKINPNVLVWRALKITQIILTFLALVWLANASVLRFGHVGKVCSGDYYD